MKHVKVLTKKGPQGVKPMTQDAIYAYECNDHANCSGGALDYCSVLDQAGCTGAGSMDQCRYDFSACYSGGHDEGCTQGTDMYACGPGQLDNCQNQVNDFGPPVPVCDPPSSDHCNDGGCDW